MDYVQEEEESMSFLQTLAAPFTMVLGFLAAYGWWIVGAMIAGMASWSRLQPKYEAWKQAKEDAEYHKDPDKHQARMEAIQLARERQQQQILAASERAKELEKEREERKRAEALERMEKYGKEGGRKLGTPEDGDYLPLSGGASTSNYRPPKKSKCGGGGCGR